MKIEPGKYYITRDGRKVGPMEPTCNNGAKFFADDVGLYFDDGTFGYGEYCRCKALDIVSEWRDEPTAHDYATLAAQHRIKITVTVDYVVVEYDGRV